MSGGHRVGLRGALARWRGRDIELKSPGELEAMLEAGELDMIQHCLKGDGSYYMPR